MPYVGRSIREELAPHSEYIAAHAGELNYQITCLLLDYLNYHGRLYRTMNEISGACTEALAEFRRRIIVPYENDKIASNGDVYS